MVYYLVAIGLLLYISTTYKDLSSTPMQYVIVICTCILCAVIETKRFGK